MNIKLEPILPNYTASSNQPNEPHGFNQHQHHHHHHQQQQQINAAVAAALAACNSNNNINNNNNNTEPNNSYHQIQNRHSLFSNPYTNQSIMAAYSNSNPLLISPNGTTGRSNVYFNSSTAQLNENSSDYYDDKQTSNKNDTSLCDDLDNQLENTAAISSDNENLDDEFDDGYNYQTSSYNKLLHQQSELVQQSSEGATNKVRKRSANQAYEYLISLSDSKTFQDWLSTNETDFTWVHKRNSMTNAGKKYYYICNYRIKKGYVRCPAVIYALFPNSNDSTVMVYSCGHHEHRRLNGSAQVSEGLGAAQMSKKVFASPPPNQLAKQSSAASLNKQKTAAGVGKQARLVSSAGSSSISSSSSSSSSPPLNNNNIG